jgi:cytoskeletal protein RodZ
MTSDPGQIQIGVALRDARRRQGMEVREVEDQTKIRARYIRALEGENWEQLPAPAYIRGFLRTYGQLLGLDGEMLVDEFRRQSEQAVVAAGGPPPGEPVLSERRRLGPSGPPRGLLIGVGIGAVVVLLIVLGALTGGDDDREPQVGEAQTSEQAQQRAERRQRQRQREREREREAAANEPQELDATLTALTAGTVCLVAGADTALIDNQTLSVDAKEKFEGNERYRLTFGPGSVRFVVGESKETLEVTEPTSFRADSKGIREIGYRGPDCP